MALGLSFRALSLRLDLSLQEIATIPGGISNDSRMTVIASQAHVLNEVEGKQSPPANGQTTSVIASEAKQSPAWRWACHFVL
jgi:hypothetical protein